MRLPCSCRYQTAAKNFFQKLLKSIPHVPRVIITAKLKSYDAVKRKSGLEWNIPSITV